MIRYTIALEELHARVEQHAPGWTARARERTEGFRKRKKYEEDRSIWSEVKPVFMALQGDGKCCFCERKFESGPAGRYELDIEHYRPKRRVKKCPKDRIGTGISATPPPEKNNGYYLLAYHLLNYAAACKPCNSYFKGSYFPIAGSYALEGDDPARMDAELPWLLYPIGEVDIDPEAVISFRGILPRSRHEDASLKRRGLATIAFLGLDDVDRRKNLLLERAQVVISLHAQLVNAAERNDGKAVAIAEASVAPSSPHANCARSFVRLFHDDRPEADAVADEATAFLLSRST